MVTRFPALCVVFVASSGCAAAPPPEPAAPVTVVELEPPKAPQVDAPDEALSEDEPAEDEPTSEEAALEGNMAILGAMRDGETTSIFGEGDPLSQGGLGLRGTGVGAGGTGEGIGLGSIGTLGRGGTGSGYGVARSGPTSQVQVGAAVTQGALPPDIIRRVVRAHLHAIKYCYERKLTSDPKLEGRLVPQFVIGPKGEVVSVRIQTGLDNEVDACVTKVFLRMAFPAPSGGGVVVVTYPFVFSAADAAATPP